MRNKDQMHGQDFAAALCTFSPEKPIRTLTEPERKHTSVGQSPTLLRAHDRRGTATAPKKKTPRTSRKKKLKRGGQSPYFPQQGEVLRPMHWVAPQARFRRKCAAAEGAAAGVESWGCFPPAARASIRSGPRRSLDNSPGLRDPPKARPPVSTRSWAELPHALERS
ncbi:unnamed protein product [Rangifer tarandus platyrhynchus]|uniref:Uncharacterized protein n=2 Tax=Rangifer tarandus platyrhynchus TaxID=3082113 RepID=A0ABN8ZHX5_RANTA|nr:unnamed protein product [Rangifer tarandus platyrhynchus]CAI9707433.1 unnamed protein product [Rangifer tarandus platyrhynchus]